jgi:hypothetical protein
MTKRSLPVLVAASCLLACGASSTRDNAVTGRVVEFGVFELGPGPPGSREVRFTEHGDVITPRLGLHFGFRFTVTKAPDRPTLDLETFVTHPPIPDKAGKIETHYELLTTIPVANRSATSVTGYSFDRPEEMAPGVWTFEHRYHGKTLVTKSFMVRGTRVSPRDILR